MVCDVHLLPSTIHILPLQTSCGALLCQALLVLVHVPLLLASCLVTIHLRYHPHGPHPAAYETSLHPYRSSSASASIPQFPILLQPSLSLSLHALSPLSHDPISKIHLQSATKMANQLDALESVHIRPSPLLTSGSMARLSHSDLLPTPSTHYLSQQASCLQENHIGLINPLLPSQLILIILCHLPCPLCLN